MFVFLFYMKVASQVSKFSPLSQVFLPYRFSKHTFLFVCLFPFLISKFCFSGTSVSSNPEYSEASPKYFQLNSQQDANPI